MQVLALRKAQVDLASVPSAAASLAGVVNTSSAFFEFAKVVIDTRAQLEDNALDAEIKTAEKRQKLKKLML
jgi:hypothetical protein